MSRVDWPGHLLDRPETAETPFLKPEPQKVRVACAPHGIGLATRRECADLREFERLLAVEPPPRPQEPGSMAPTPPHGSEPCESAFVRLPRHLQDPDDELARLALRRYYNLAEYQRAEPFTGAHFDTWDSKGTQAEDSNLFTADDLVAVSFLSVDVKATAALTLLDTDASRFAELLRQLGPDRDLADEAEPWSDEWAGWVLWRELRGLPDVGPTTASKLLARKRPRLRPIFDSVVAQVIGSENVWEPLRVMLRQDSRSLDKLLVRIRDEVGLPSQVSALRVFDVIAWMEGKGFAPAGPGVVGAD